MSMKSNQTKEDPSCLKRLGNDQYSAQLSTGLNQLRKESSFCDVTIIVGEQRFPAHKAVLSCASSYFQGMFSAGFQESSMSEVTVPGTEECFAQLLEFAYTGYLSLSLRTAAGILRMASYMVLRSAMKLCAEYLQDVKSKLSVDDCFEVWSIATNHDILKDVVESFQDQLVRNFPKCGRSSVFLENVAADHLLQMLVDGDIETDSSGEEQIVEVVLAWLKHDWEHRHTHAADLLKKLRLGLLPLDKLEELLGEEVFGIPECKAIVEEVRRLDATKEEADVPLILSQPDLFASRNTVTGELSWCRSSSSFVRKTTSGCYQLEHLNNHPCQYHYSLTRSPMTGFTVVDDTELYIACGYEYVFLSNYKKPAPANVRMLHYAWLKENNFCKYDFGTNQWTVLRPMEYVLEGINISVHRLGDFIYAIGHTSDKRGGYNYLIQRYNLITNEWIDHVKVETEGKRISIKNHVIVEDKILFTGFDSDIRVGLFSKDAYLLYDPASNKIHEVLNMGENLGDDVMDWLHPEVDKDGTCYFLSALEAYGPDERNCYKAVCDFSGSQPSIKLEYQRFVCSEYCDMRRRDSLRPNLTFDGKKLKMAEMALKFHCHCPPSLNYLLEDTCN